MSQGTAFVHNLFVGELFVRPDTNRFTLYHLPHSTMVGGVMLVYGGDDRLLNNIFIGNDGDSSNGGTYGTICYNGYSNSTVKKTTDNDTPAADIGRTLPTKIKNNLYLSGAKACKHEQNPRFLPGFKPEFIIEEEDGYFWLRTNFTDMPSDMVAERVATESLGIAFEAEQPFENRDGSPVSVDSDFSDSPRGEKTFIGPFERWCKKIRLCKIT